ncbi:MAG: carboxypeptidase regulatory-like domain-containing protein [Burkholderiaceae bacterium]
MLFPDRFSASAALGFALTVLTVPALAQNTTSAMGGRITGADGKPVAEAEVTILHVPSGSANKVRTDTEGRYLVRGLRAGGPYTITVVQGGATEKRDEVFLPLAETTNVDVQVGPVAKTLDAVVVTGANALRFNSSNMGAGTSLGSRELAAAPSISGNLQDFARLDPRVSQTDKERGEISAVGQNSRFNTFTVNGVNINDTFGIEANNLPFIRQPIPMEAISAVQVNISNYDVTQKGYTGANINATTKSGTNEFKGSVYGSFFNEDLAGKRFNATDGSYTKPLPFEVRNLGATLGGPIIADKVFFFVALEDYKSTRAAPDFGPIGSSRTNVGITPSAIAGAQSIAANTFGLSNIGTNDVPAGSELTFKTALAKLDWNINDRNRVGLLYTDTKQNEPFFPNLGTRSLSLNSHWYNQEKKLQTVVGEWFSNWTDAFSTELKVSNRDYESRPLNNARLPQVALNFTGNLPPGTPGTVATGTRSLFFGTERSRHFNELSTKTQDVYASGNYLLGDHEIKFGLDYSKNKIFNAFLQDTYGNYTFSCVNSSATYTYSFGAINCATATAAQIEQAVLENYQRGRPSSYLAQLAAPGSTIQKGAADWTLQNTGLFAQDTWSATNNLTLMYGMRVDRTGVPTKPAANSAAAVPVGPLSAATPTSPSRQTGGFGLDNTQTIDGETLIQPRIGFNLKLDAARPMQVRGGFGLFQGAAANVWLSNPFSNTGVSTRVIGCGTLGFSACPPGGGIFNGNPDAPPTNVAGSNPAANVDFIEKGLSQPAVWKMNLAFEHELPWNGLVVGAELVYVKNKEAIYYKHLNLGAPTALGTDGRELFYNQAGLSQGCWNADGTPNTSGTLAPGVTCSGAVNSVRARALNNASFNNVLLATSTKQGDSGALTFSLSQPMRQGWGWSAAYTRSTSKEVNPLTSSVSNSNWAARSVFNPNEEVTANSAYLVRDRFSASLNWERSFFANLKTSVGLFYEGRKGKPYSWTFNNDANGDGVAGNDLMYIPSAPGSGEVVFRNPADEARFWEIVNANSAMRNAKGGVVKRNSAFSPFAHSFDMRVSQELPGFTAQHKAALVLDIFNVGNLLNKKWGRVDEIGFQSGGGQARSFVNYAGLDGGRYVYSVSPTVEDFVLRQVSGESQWAAQISLRYEF